MGYLSLMSERPFIPLGVGILTVSDTRTLETDTRRGLLVSELERTGHRIVRREILPDDLLRLRETIRSWIADPEVEVILANCGTGITARDVTPDAVAPLVTKAIPGFGELFRHLSYADIGPSTIQSRAEGALCDTTLVFTLPGSTGACRLALEKILLPQLDARTR